ESIDHVAVRRRDPNDPPDRIPGRGIRRAGGIGKVVKADQLAALRVELGKLTAAVEREVDDVVVADRDAPRAGISVRQLDRSDESLLLDVEAADRAVAELAVPDLAEVSGHDQPVERGAPRASRRRRRGPDLRRRALGIEVADGVVADIGEPDAAAAIGQKLVLVAEAEVMDAGNAPVVRHEAPRAPREALDVEMRDDAVEERRDP